MLRRRFLLLPLLTLALTGPAFAQAPALVPTRIKITSAADLPVHTYTVTSKNRPLAEDPAVVSALAAAVTKDITGDLAQYDISDRSTLRQMYLTLEKAALLQQDYGAVRQYIGIARSLQDKPADKATSGLILGPLADALQTPGADFHETLRANIEQAYRYVPTVWARSDAQQQERGIRLATRDLLVAIYADKADPVPNTDVVSQNQAKNIIGEALQLHYVVPNKSDYLTALATILANNPSASKMSIWTAREVTLSASRKLVPVTVAVWDTGVDSHLYRSQRVSGTPGFAYDARSQPKSPLLPTLPAGAATAYQHDLAGLTDMGSGVESPAAAALRARLTHLSPLQIRHLMTGVLAFGSYVHGTFVAGIALRGNPAARLLVFRIPPQSFPSVTRAEANAATYQKTIDTFKARGVRVVNMSWDVSPEKIQRVLEREGRGGSPAERRRLAQQLYDIGSRGFSQAVQSAPHILFVAAAGNQNENIQFNQSYPASLRAPNLIVVGAVDGAGDETSFTSFGNVDVYADGVDVSSFVPGGATLKLSGTSMAAPQVTNLAAKVLAEHPALSVAQLKAAILRGADPHAVGGKTIRLLNPKKTLAQLRAYPNRLW